MKRKVMAVAMAAGMVLGLSACASEQASNPDYARICVDKDSHERVDGAQCGSDDGSALNGFLWGYILFGQRMPAYGAPITNVYHTVYSVPKAAVVEHDERLAPKGGKAYVKSTTPRSYTTGSGKKIGTFKGTSGFKSSGGYKAPAPKAPGTGYKAPAQNGGGYKAPAVKAPAPVYRPPAPVYRAPSVKFR